MNPAAKGLGRCIRSVAFGCECVAKDFNGGFAIESGGCSRRRRCLMAHAHFARRLPALTRGFAGLFALAALADGGVQSCSFEMVMDLRQVLQVFFEVFFVHERSPVTSCASF
jgi:hypothetical protein